MMGKSSCCGEPKSIHHLATESCRQAAKGSTKGYVAVALLVNGILGNFFELRRLAFVTTAGRAGRQAAAAAGVRMLLGQSQVLGVEVQTAT